jgi:diadenosine tetraphosphate (Ap4A) HIT family hydrolase
VFCTTALLTWKLDPTDVSCMAGHANVRTTLLMYVGTTAGVLDRARKATVVWRYGHVAEPGDLDPLQAGRYRAEVLAAGRAVQARFKPVKLNYMTLGNTVPHLHTHVLPRYQDDPAPGGPIAWEAIFAADPVPEAELHRQAADLRGLLDT